MEIKATLSVVVCGTKPKAPGVSVSAVRLGFSAQSSSGSDRRGLTHGATFFNFVCERGQEPGTRYFF